MQDLILVFPPVLQLANTAQQATWSCLVYRFMFIAVLLTFF